MCDRSGDKERHSPVNRVQRERVPPLGPTERRFIGRTERDPIRSVHVYISIRSSSPVASGQRVDIFSVHEKDGKGRNGDAVLSSSFSFRPGWLLKAARSRSRPVSRALTIDRLWQGPSYISIISIYMIFFFSHFSARHIAHDRIKKDHPALKESKTKDDGPPKEKKKFYFLIRLQRQH